VKINSPRRGIVEAGAETIAQILSGRREESSGPWRGELIFTTTRHIPMQSPQKITPHLHIQYPFKGVVGAKPLHKIKKREKILFLYHRGEGRGHLAAGSGVFQKVI